MSLDFNRLVTVVRTLNQATAEFSHLLELNWRPKLIKLTQVIPHTVPVTVLIQVPEFGQ